MNRAASKSRIIRFYSEKNQCMVSVRSPLARDYAKWLEDQSWVERYETGHELDAGRLASVCPVDIRSSYFQTEWLTDFLIFCADGRKAVREVADLQRLQKRAEIEKLELSRRYWTGLDIGDWRIVVEEGVEK